VPRAMPVGIHYARMYQTGGQLVGLRRVGFQLCYLPDVCAKDPVNLPEMLFSCYTFFPTLLQTAYRIYILSENAQFHLEGRVFPVEIGYFPK